MQLYKVAIVGAGPRGLGVLERLIALYDETRPDWALQVDLMDPGEPGQGAHPSSQPAHLLTNTVAGQITLFTDPSVRDAGPIRPGPSFLDWAKSAGYRRVDGGFVRTANDGQPVHEDDYLPRAMLGDYLSHIYDRLAGALPANLRITHHRRMVEDIVPLPDGKLRVAMAGGFCIIADCAVITTGHSENAVSAQDEALEAEVLAAARDNPKLLYLASVNPISRLQAISSDAEVAVQGIGLTAYDVISELTVGRGGRFAAGPDRRLTYQPSGREPRIVLYSRQGVPFSARGVNQKGIAGLHRPVFFTRPWIDELRRQKAAAEASPKLDYSRELWPMLRKEMCFVYDTTVSGAPPDPARYVPSAASEQAIELLLAPLGDGGFDDQRGYDQAVRRHIERDLAQAFEGNVRNPVKAATDVLRDVRDYVRHAVDYGGLTEPSHREFLQDIIPTMYRISAGAPKERNIELLALLDAGIASFGPGPNPSVGFDSARARFVMRSTRLGRATERSVDVLVRARIDCAVYPEQQPSALMRNMLRSGALRAYSNGGFQPGGIDVDLAQHVIDADGRPHPNLWALGIVVEGANWCTYVLPRALVNSRFHQFSGRCALDMFALLGARHAQSSTATPAAVVAKDGRGASARLPDNARAEPTGVL